MTAFKQAVKWNATRFLLIAHPIGPTGLAYLPTKKAIKINEIHVGKYASPMDGMCISMYSFCWHVQNTSLVLRSLMLLFSNAGWAQPRAGDQRGGGWDKTLVVWGIFVGDENTSYSYMGIILNRYENPYSTTRISQNSYPREFFFRGSVDKSVEWRISRSENIRFWPYRPEN